MPNPSHALWLLGLLGSAGAVFKQWIPDTNYDNATNWDTGKVPCGSDEVQFPAQRKVSVFVETSHAVKETTLPLDGEFILNPGAGFHSGPDPGCGEGAATRFRDSESLRWFDPALWIAGETEYDLENGDLLFFVHEESVPCRHDNVVFRSESSFRVDVSSDGPGVPVKAVDLFGMRYEIPTVFAEYLGSGSGRLQFHGSSKVTVGGLGCQDQTGCDCGNSGNRDRICQNVKCGTTNCKEPLTPIGHCCEVCGAIVGVTFGPTFYLHAYRERIKFMFLNKPQYGSVRLAMSKVSKPQRLMGIIPWGSAAEIQLVILDQADGKEAEALARDIVADAGSHGGTMGIVDAKLEVSSGGGQSGGNATGTAVGVSIAVLILVAAIVVAGALISTGRLRIPSLPRFLSRTRSDGDLDAPIDTGFANPMFDKPTMMPRMPGLYGNEPPSSITMTQTGVHFVNPVYDENETDFAA